MIITESLCKNYGSFTAVQDLNLNVDKGIFYGLLGPNGAGKTTTIKMLAMLLHPTSGDVFVNGAQTTRNSIESKKIIGMVPQHFSLQRDMSVEETLVLHGLLYKLNKKEIKSRIDELLSFANMTQFKSKRISTLSGGNKRKLMIIRSMMHNPRLLFLDEPTVGLDPSIRRSIWDLLKKLKTVGLTIILTTHYIEEANILCDKIGFISDGLLIKEASPSAFIQEIKPIVLEYFNGNKTVYKHFNSQQEAGDYAKDLDGEVHIRKSNLEDVYVKYTKQRISK